MKPPAIQSVLARLSVELRDGVARPGALDMVSAWTGAAFFRAIEQLLAARRPALVRAMLASGPRALREPLAVAWAEARAALDQGDLAAAAIARDALARAPARAALVDARLALDAGDPARARTLALTVDDPRLAGERAAVLADVCAIAGDRDGARVHLAALRPRALARLADSSRPSAAVAAALRTGTSAPYR